MWKTAKWSIFALAVTLVIVLSGVVGHTLGSGDSGTAPISGSQEFGILDEIYSILQEDFVDPQIDPEQLKRGAINGIIESLGDAHTVYIDPETIALGVDVISGTFQGIGATVDQDPVTRDIVIITPFRDSPAERAGIRPGDVIKAVDDESTEGWTVAQAVQRIRGPDGTPVTLTVQHNDGQLEEIEIVRATIVIPTVFSNVGDDPDLQINDADGNPVQDIAYIEVQQFTEQTVRDLAGELLRVQEGGYEALILDLRRNPGGSLNATVAVADMFLGSGVILMEVDRHGRETSYDANPGGEALDIQVAVLMGPGSASGSEVLAGALRDNERAILIGETTFGKGSINQLRELSDGGAIYVTTARWLTPSGEQIEGVGIAPDIEVASDEEELLTGSGPQLFTAINYLRENFTRAR
jgi:carboxyl-terminal processing protease